MACSLQFPLDSASTDPLRLEHIPRHPASPKVLSLWACKADPIGSRSSGSESAASCGQELSQLPDRTVYVCGSHMSDHLPFLAYIQMACSDQSQAPARQYQDSASSPESSQSSHIQDMVSVHRPACSSSSLWTSRLESDLSSPPESQKCSWVCPLRLAQDMGQHGLLQISS